MMKRRWIEVLGWLSVSLLVSRLIGNPYVPLWFVIVLELVITAGFIKIILMLEDADKRK